MVNMSHVPNALQATKLTNLAAARVTAESNLTSATASLVTAQVNYKNSPSASTASALATAVSNLVTARSAYRSAAGDHSEYNSFVFGCGVRSNTLDSGGPDGI